MVEERTPHLSTLSTPSNKKKEKNPQKQQQQQRNYEWAVPAMPCEPSGLLQVLVLWFCKKGGFTDRWLQQSGSLSVKHMRGAAEEKMPVAVDARLQQS